MHLFEPIDADRFRVTDPEHVLAGLILARFDHRRDLYAPVCADAKGVFLDHTRANHIWPDELEAYR